ncbi:hypothetical protein DBR44_11035 [Aquitalea sp. FJL05]|nr:hypothetical protein DBR44_11035 [Aquitalea sp. FJL05]
MDHGVIRKRSYRYGAEHIPARAGSQYVDDLDKGRMRAEPVILIQAGPGSKSTGPVTRVTATQQ